jgi:hypothetical protein
MQLVAVSSTRSSGKFNSAFAVVLAGLLAREIFRVLLIVRHGQNIIERGRRGLQDHLDGVDGVSGLFANVSAEFLR